jgi:hypothetical protein
MLIKSKRWRRATCIAGVAGIVVAIAIGIFIAQAYYSADEPIWNRTWRDASNDRGHGVWCDREWNVYTCGETGPLGGGFADAILFKWDANGNQIWYSTWDCLMYENFNAVWGDGDGYIYTCGYAMDYFAEYYAMVIVKWDTDGNQVWNITWCDIGRWTSMGYDIWGDEWGYFYTYGTLENQTTHSSSVLVAKWDASGNQVWNGTWGGGPSHYGRCVMGDGEGNIYTCGIGTSSISLVKWDPAGNQVWERLWDGMREYGGTSSIWVDDINYIYICGNTYDHGVQHTVLGKCDTNGNQVWNSTWGGSRNVIVYDIWGDGWGGIYTGGSSSDPSTNDNSDLLLVKWNASGSAIWSRTWGALGDDKKEWVESIWGDGSESIYLCGASGIVDELGYDDMILVKWAKELIDLTPLSIVAIVIASIAIVALTIATDLHLKLENVVGKVRSRRESASAREKTAPKVVEVVYKQRTHKFQHPSPSVQQPTTSTGACCPTCGQPIPKGFENAAFCVFCGKNLSLGDQDGTSKVE